MRINIKNKLRQCKKTLKEMGKIDRKILKNGSFSMLYTVLLVAVIVVINLIIGEVPEKYTQLDVSEQKLYTISDETVKFLRDLQEDVTIYHIVQNGNEDEILEKMLNRYEETSKHITVETKDPVLYPNFTSQYTKDSVSDNSLIVVNGEKSKVIAYNSLYEANYDYYTGSSSTTGFDGEGQIDSAISYVTSEDIPVLYTLQGHGELEMNSSLTESLERANYQVESLNLLTEENVPDDTGCLLIASPQTDISEEEAEKIISYLEKGGKSMIFTDYTNVEMPNLKKVLENYGITKKDGVVLEEDTKHYMMQIPYYLIPDMESTDIIEELVQDNRYILMPVSQGIQTLDSYRDTLTIEPILTTSSNAYIKTDVENMKTFEKEEGNESGEFYLGVAVTETVDDENETQIAYYSSSSLLDEATDQQVSGGNTELIVNTLRWMCENETPVIQVTSKNMMVSNLTIPEYDAGYWAAITCGIIPAAFLLAGTVIWFKRRKQ